MAVSTVESEKVQIKLNNGTDGSGNIKTVSISLGQLNPNAFNADKALSVTEALEACLSKTINSVLNVTTKELVAD